jgi:exodeoxyribonuclease VII large subunit
MLETLRIRWPLAEVRLFPVLVQGDSAAREIANTLRWINSFAELPDHRLDVVLLGRGGGSREDLWAFNREEVARAIAACVVPIVTGIGHEHDVTIADLVADMRGVTPTDAAGRVSPQLNAIQQGVLGLGESLVRGMERRVERLRGRLDRARPLVLGKLLVSRVAKARQTTTESSRRLQTALLNHLKARRNQLAVLSGKLDAISPLRVLARGYSLTQTICDGTGNKKLLTEASKVLIGDTLVTRLAKGSVVSAVLEVHPGLEPVSNSKDGAR